MRESYPTLQAPATGDSVPAAPWPPPDPAPCDVGGATIGDLRFSDDAGIDRQVLLLHSLATRCVRLANAVSCRPEDLPDGVPQRPVTLPPEPRLLAMIAELGGVVIDRDLEPVSEMDWWGDLETEQPEDAEQPDPPPPPSPWPPPDPYPCRVDCYLGGLTEHDHPKTDRLILVLHSIAARCARLAMAICCDIEDLPECPNFPMTLLPEPRLLGILAELDGVLLDRSYDPVTEYDWAGAWDGESDDASSADGDTEGDGEPAEGADDVTEPREVEP